MDDIRFDHLSRRLGAAITRRRGIAGVLGTLAGAVGISVADAKVVRPPVDCRSTGMPCISGDECCSGRCIPKVIGTSRCARKTSNRKKKHGGKNGGSTPVPPGPSCTVCANGCPFTTIEAAINATPTNPSETAIISVGPGTYRPERLDPDAPAPLMIGTNMLLTACDFTQPMPIIDASGITEGESLFFLGSLDEQYDCTQTSTIIVIEGFTITGGSGIAAIISDCNTYFALRGSILENFSSPGAVVRHSGDQSGIFQNCTVRNNISANAQGAIANCTSSAPYAVLEFQSTLVTGNTSTTIGQNGGIIGALCTIGVVLGGTTNIYNNVVPNTAFGGGVYVLTGLDIQGSAQIVGNTGSALGGGIYQATGAAVIGATSSNVNGNLATTCDNYYNANTSGCPF